MDAIALSLPAAPAAAAVHHLPCAIRYDGAAKVSTYFVPEPVARSGGAAEEPAAAGASAAPTLAAYFRGRRLDGTVVALPRGVTGAVLREVAPAAPAAPLAAAARAGSAAAAAGGGGFSGVQTPAARGPLSAGASDSSSRSTAPFQAGAPVLTRSRTRPE